LKHFKNILTYIHNY